MRRSLLPVLSLSASVLAGCDPVLNIAGANFPAWLVCAVAGVVGAALLHPVFVATRLEPHLWPLPLVYLSLAGLIACLAYLAFFGRT